MKIDRTPGGCASLSAALYALLMPRRHPAGAGADAPHRDAARTGRPGSPTSPSSWNGTLLLYSHGFGPLLAADAPDPVTQAALLAEGYALAGSSYDPNGSWWALGSAVRDQFETLATVEKSVLPPAPHTSMPSAPRWAD